MFTFYKPGEIIKTHIRKRQAEGATFIAIFTREKSFLGFSYKKYYLADLKKFHAFQYIEADNESNGRLHY